MKKNIELLLTATLLGGTAFSWTTVYYDFLRFYKIYGTIFKISGCTTPNPILTPCFYGAIAFGICLGLSIYKRYNYLWWLLLGGTIFAWSNFTYEAYKFYFAIGPKVSCSGIVTDSVFKTPCFYGAVIYLIALVTFKFLQKFTTR